MQGQEGRVQSAGWQVRAVRGCGMLLGFEVPCLLGHVAMHVAARRCARAAQCQILTSCTFFMTIKLN